MCNVHKKHNIDICIVYLDIGARDSPARDISFQGAIGQGISACPGLFALRRVSFLVDSSDAHDVMMVFIYLQGSGQDFRRLKLYSELRNAPYLHACAADVGPYVSGFPT